MCPNCKNNRLFLLYNCDEYILLQCKDCKLIMKYIHNINRKEIQELQDNEYDDIDDRTMLKKIYYKMAKERLKYLNKFKQNGKVLEIGCATGEFLFSAKDAGFDVCGIEASKKYSSYAIKKGLNVKYGRLEDIELQKSTFDIIAMFHLIEHIENPNEFIKKVYEYLKPKGLLYIITPNVESLTNKIFRYKHPNFQQSDHLFFFSSKTINNIFLNNGFKIISISSKEYIHNPFTSLFGFLLGIIKKYKQYKILDSYENYTTNSNWNKKLNKGKLFTKKIIKQLPYFMGYLFYPILKLYGKIIERFNRGNELIVIAQK